MIKVYDLLCGKVEEDGDPKLVSPVSKKRYRKSTCFARDLMQSIQSKRQAIRNQRWFFYPTETVWRMEELSFGRSIV